MNEENACSQGNCYYPETSCQLGHLSECPNMKKSKHHSDIPLNVNEDVSIAWTGSAMGHADVAYVAGKIKPFVIGVFGAENAGKTSLLGAWYLLIGKGVLRSTKWQFAGSRTLEGWETVANGLRWMNNQTPPSFPPHTSSRSGRSPGLLHLSLCHSLNGYKEFLFTDAPGEWFKSWTQNADTDQAVGAKWVASKSDVLLIVADSEALSSTYRGRVRNELQYLINQVASSHQNRPVALVWTKSDVKVDNCISTAIKNLLHRHIPNAVEFEISLKEDNAESLQAGLFELLVWILDRERTKSTVSSVQVSSQDPLFLFGSR